MGNPYRSGVIKSETFTVEIAIDAAGRIVPEGEQVIGELAPIRLTLLAEVPGQQVGKPLDPVQAQAIAGAMPCLVGDMLKGVGIAHEMSLEPGMVLRVRIIGHHDSANYYGLFERITDQFIVLTALDKKSELYTIRLPVTCCVIESFSQRSGLEQLVLTRWEEGDRPLCTKELDYLQPQTVETICRTGSSTWERLYASLKLGDRTRTLKILRSQRTDTTIDGYIEKCSDREILEELTKDKDWESGRRAKARLEVLDLKKK